MSEHVLSNAKLVFEKEQFKGSIKFNNGIITAIDKGTQTSKKSIDCNGDFVCPGLIELHTDNLERHMEPRPGVTWPLDAALLSHDSELASVGITTVYDALRVGSIISETKKSYPKYAKKIVKLFLEMLKFNFLRVSHFIHLRAEICSETLIEELDEFSKEDRIGILSMMDHTPGQRQFRDISKMAEYLKGKYSMSKNEINEHFNLLYQLQEKNGKIHTHKILECSKYLNTVLASHDDTTLNDVLSSKKMGVKLAEFPTTLEAAKASNKNGLMVIMGAPNLLRGKSHSGNLSAIDLVEEKTLSILSSDYMPSSLLLGAIKLGIISEDMCYGIATVTSNPAKAMGLKDRGVLEIGKRADLLRFCLYKNKPILKQSWLRGSKIIG